MAHTGFEPVISALRGRLGLWLIKNLFYRWILRGEWMISALGFGPVACRTPLEYPTEQLYTLLSTSDAVVNRLPEGCQNARKG